MSPISKNKKLAKNTLFLYLRMLLVLVVSLYTTRVVIHSLGVVDYGINNVVAGFVSMFAFLNTSMSNGVQRYYNFTLGSEGEESLTPVYNTALLIQFLLAIIIVILLETIGVWYLNNKMVIPIDRMKTARWVYQFSVLSLVFVVLQIPYSAAIMAHERMDYYAYVSIIEVALKLGFALYLPYVAYDRLFVYSCYVLGVGALSFFMYFSYSKLHFKSLRIQFKFNKGLFVDMLSFSGWNIFGTFAYMLKNQGLNVLLNAFFGPIVNAARGVSALIGNSIQGFQSNIVVSFRPQMVQSFAEGNLSRVKSLMYSLSKISYLMLYMLSMPVILELPYILTLWLGDDAPNYTISFTILMLIIMMLSSFNTPLSQVVHATGKMKNYQIGTSIVICAILPLAWIALKLGGNPNMVYYVSIIMTIINQCVCLMLLKRVFSYHIGEYLKEVIWPCTLVSFIAAILPAICHFSIPSSFGRLVLVAVVGVVSTVFTSFVIALNENEKNIIASFIQGLFRKENGRS